MTDQRAPHAPPFCPNRDCPFHYATEGWRRVKNGFFTRDAAPTVIQRFRCCHCGRHFSEQTFRTTYWFKRPKLQIAILRGLVSCSCLRQMGRALECSPQTVLLHANRLGRHCQLFHELHRPKGQLTERIALDGLQSFEYSQFHPTWYNAIAGRASYFVYGLTDSELRRSGTMTPAQKRKRAKLEAAHGRPHTRSTLKATADVLGIVCKGSTDIELDTDEHQDYPRAIRMMPWLKVTHHTISSRAARTTQNPLFVVNLLDLLIRHSSADHKRETIAFPKRRQMSIWRLWVTTAWRNYMKWTSERRHKETPAMRLGIMTHRLRPKQLLKERLFESRIELPETWKAYYFGKVVTRMIPNGRQHQLKYAT